MVIAQTLSMALSGAQAQTTRLQVSASNVANAHTDGPLQPTVAPGAEQRTTAAPYKALTVAQSSLVAAQEIGGTRAVAVEKKPPVQRAYDPDAAYADGDGFVARPNVDVLEETVRQMMAATGFGANLSVARTTDEMAQTVLDLTT